jgi:hypothetical protein
MGLWPTDKDESHARWPLLIPNRLGRDFRRSEMAGFNSYGGKSQIHCGGESNRQDKLIEPLVAPVRRHPRYHAKPVYYSDMIVRADTSFKSFEELRGCSWAYNERGSHSGFNIVGYYLAMRGFDQSFFGRVVESGSHRKSLEMVLRGSVDTAAIDSSVLELEVAKDPAISGQIRTVEALGAESRSAMGCP